MSAAELGKIVRVDGSAFKCINGDKYLSLDGRIMVRVWRPWPASRRVGRADTFVILIDGEVVCGGKFMRGRRFRTPEGAMRAAAKEIEL